MKKLPSISISIVTLNNERTLERCIDYIQSQDYPTSKIEYLAIEGGSTDRTIEILTKRNFRIITSPIRKDAEAQRGVGLLEAKNNLIVSLDADNYIKDRQWLRKMIQPFLDDPSIVHAGTLHYGYDPKDTALNRYCALFGMADPIVFYVGRPDRVPHYQQKWTLGSIIRETKDYYVVKFSKETLPTVGCNGVVYRKDLLLKYARSNPREFLHIDVFVDLLEKGLNKFAVVNSEVTHDTAASLGLLMKKRIAFMKSYYLRTKGTRRYLIIDPQNPCDVWKACIYVFYTLTFIKPFIDSFRGYLFIHDVAWFLHPLMCWIYLYSYGLATLKRLFSWKIS